MTWDQREFFLESLTAESSSSSADVSWRTVRIFGAWFRCCNENQIHQESLCHSFGTRITHLPLKYESEKLAAIIDKILKVVLVEKDMCHIPAFQARWLRRTHMHACYYLPASFSCFGSGFSATMAGVQSPITSRITRVLVSIVDGSLCENSL